MKDSLKGIVVVVDDEWLIRMELSDALSGAGLNVLEVASGEAALALLPANHPVRILVTDIRLGAGIDGWDVADAYCAQYPKLPVIYASGNAPLAHRQVAGSVFLTKPVRIPELLSTAEQMLSGGTA